mgnify:CR=1 FL=1
MKLDKEFTLPSAAEVSIIPVMQGEGLQKIDESELPAVLPILALRNAVLFPGAVFPITIGREKSIKLIGDAEKEEFYIGAIPQNDVMVEEPQEEDLFRYGTVCRILKTIEMPDGTITAILQAYKRLELESVIGFEPYITARVHYLPEVLHGERSADVKALSESLKDRAIQIIKGSNMGTRETIGALKAIDNFTFLVNFIATTVEVENFEGKVGLLEYDDLKVRALKLLKLLEIQVQLMNIKQEINAKVKNEIDQQQREYYLNNQLRTIQEELGMDGDGEMDHLRERAAAKNWPESVAKTFEKELARLEKYNPNSPDYSVQYNYLEFMLELPWNDMSEDNLDLKHAQEVLDKDHFGLENVKDRIIEYLAVLKLKGNMKSPILCLYGPPGVGKTSLGKSIAAALGRKYVRVSLGGLRDESEIRGHRKTYIGAMPGRIIQNMRKAKYANPVFVLDEIDKITGMNVQGDPSAALLEVMDPEQNSEFYDNYLETSFDLSRVLFIATANDLGSVHPALRDRMEIIEVPGYLAEEKLEIAKRHLVPKQLEENGLSKKDLQIPAKTIETVISEYTRESGVRTLERTIAKVIRKRAAQLVQEGHIEKKVEPNDLKEILGSPIFQLEKAFDNSVPGVATGLAWTAVGGEILFVEALTSPGKGELTMTGSLGDVMKESATIAYEYLKAHAGEFGIDPAVFEKKKVHVHVPEGAIPKDGPSAGITMTTALVSAFTKRKVRARIAMTGEMTLRGKVLPIGGVKEKILAAKRAGITDLILCQDNQKDVDEIPQIYLKGLHFHYVKDIQEVIDYALL